MKNPIFRAWSCTAAFAGLLLCSPMSECATAQTVAQPSQEEREMLEFFQIDEPGPGATAMEISLYSTQWFLKDLEDDRTMKALVEVAEANMVCGYSFLSPHISERWHAYRDRKIESELRAGPYINYLRSRLDDASLKKQVRNLLHAAERRFTIRPPFRNPTNPDLVRECTSAQGRIQGLYMAAP